MSSTRIHIDVTGLTPQESRDASLLIEGALKSYFRAKGPDLQVRASVQKPPAPIPSLHEVISDQHRVDLIAAILAEYPEATSIKINVERDGNNPGYWYPTYWRVFEGESLSAEHVVDDGSFDEELSDYVDELRITNDFVLDLTP